MSDLGFGRASNGGARTGGPVPVPQPSGTPTGLKTPRDVMRHRREREARQQEEAKAEEDRRRQQADDRRKSAERRAAAMNTSGEPRYSQASSQYTPDVSAQQGSFGGPSSRLSGSGQVASGAALGEPTGRMTTGDSGYATGSGQTGRVRGSSVSQDQPRPAQPTPSEPRRRTQASQSAPRQPASAQHASAGTSTRQSQPSQEQPNASDGAAGGGGARSSSFPYDRY